MHLGGEDKHRNLCRHILRDHLPPPMELDSFARFLEEGLALLTRTAGSLCGDESRRLRQDGAKNSGAVGALSEHRA